MIRVLLFEDRPQTVPLVIQKLANHVPSGEQAEIVWFNGPFDPPRSSIYAATVEVGYEPQVIHVRDGRVVETTVGSRIWWPSQFHAAILDIFMEPERPIGNDYLKWLNDAGFSGFVATVTGRANSFFYPRSDIREHFRKEQGDGIDAPWTNEASKLAIQRAAIGRPEWRVTNYKGRDPSRFVTDFYQTVGYKPRWSCAFFGDDVRLANDLRAFFDLPLPFDRTVTSNISALPAVLIDKKVRERVVWIDCNGPLSDGFVMRVLDVLERKEWFHRPFSFLLANADALVTNDLRDRLSRVNAAFVDRSMLCHDAGRCAWVAEAVTELAKSYTAAKAIDKEAPGSKRSMNANADVVRKLPVPFLIAQGMQRLCGTEPGTGPPSLPYWTSRETGEKMNTNFPFYVRDSWLPLQNEGLITEHQVRPFTK